MKHTHQTKNTYIYNAKLDMSTWTFAKTSARTKFLSPMQKKTLAETVPKALHKGNPFHGPFAQLSSVSVFQLLKTDILLVPVFSA